MKKHWDDWHNICVAILNIVMYAGVFSLASLIIFGVVMFMKMLSKLSVF